MKQNFDYAEIINQLAGHGQTDTATVKIVDFSARLRQAMKKVQLSRGGKRHNYVYAASMKSEMVVGSFQKIGNARVAPNMMQRKRWRRAK